MKKATVTIAFDDEKLGALEFSLRKEHSSVPMLFESTRLASGKVITKQKLQYPVRILEFLVERSNPNPNHCPLGHLWRRFHRK